MKNKIKNNGNEYKLGKTKINMQKTKKQMAKHSKRRLDLYCRKALSTAAWVQGRPVWRSAHDRPQGPFFLKPQHEI